MYSILPPRRSLVIFTFLGYLTASSVFLFFFKYGSFSDENVIYLLTLADRFDIDVRPEKDCESIITFYFAVDYRSVRAVSSHFYQILRGCQADPGQPLSSLRASG